MSEEPNRQLTAIIVAILVLASLAGASFFFNRISGAMDDDFVQNPDSENENETRLVRRDGAVLEPTLGPEALARIDHDSIKDAVYVTSKIPEQGQMTGDEVRLLTRGAKAIVYAFQEGSGCCYGVKD